jgi:hypothetical protein
VTFYEDYFPDYRNGLLPLLDFAGLPQPEEGSQMEKQLAAFHSADLNHHASTMDEVMSDPTIPNLAKELYAQLLSAGWGGSNIPLLEHADLFFQLLTDAKVSADLLTVTLIRNGREIPEGRPLAAECFRFANELVNERDHVNQVLNSRVHRVAAIVGQTLADVKGRHARVPNAVSRPGKNRSGIADNSKLGREDFSANNADQNEPTLESSSPSAL